jgi:predicted alpha/beta-fold hydrolase
MTGNRPDIFSPRPWARSAHLQTIFASLKYRLRGRNEMLECARETVLDGFEGSRLLGYLSRRGDGKARGLVLLIHGWEGSSDSTYILSTGRTLFNSGYDVLRLNLRDHGPSHHLNTGLFHGALIEETHNAVINAAGMAEGRPFFVVGFSLGANFALRVALRHSLLPVPGLRHVFGISPALDPHQATLSIDRSIYRLYFLRKWKRSLTVKQRLFPGLYDFSELLKMHSCMEMTEAIMPLYSSFAGYREYFSMYTLRRPLFAGLSVPVTAIASEDDPVIPVGDLRELEGSPNLEISIQRYGGHCGFLDPFPSGCWYERRICDILQKY